VKKLTGGAERKGERLPDKNVFDSNWHITPLTNGNTVYHGEKMILMALKSMATGLIHVKCLSYIQTALDNDNILRALSMNIFYAVEVSSSALLCAK